LLAEERRYAIFKVIKNNGSASTEELADTFRVSGSTIRRDLSFLANKNLIRRTHSGALMNTTQPEARFLSAHNTMQAEKRKIARKALKLIKDGDFVAFSGGTTSFMLAIEVINSKLSDLTVLTNSINISLLILESRKDFRLIVAGGLHVKGSYECVGEMTHKMVRGFNIDRFFMGANGVSELGGISFVSFEEAEVSREILGRSREAYVIVDHSKLEVTKSARVAALKDVAAIITDEIPEELKTRYQRAGATVID